MEPVVTPALILAAVIICCTITFVFTVAGGFILKQDVGMFTTLTGFMIGALIGMFVTTDLLVCGLTTLICTVQGLGTGYAIKAIKRKIGFAGWLEDPKPCKVCGRN